MSSSSSTTAGTKAGRAAPVRKTRFDMGERERIRTALLRYMQAHSIGVPALQARLAEDTDRGLDLIPLKTLQRFLAGTHRTNDAFIAICHQFTSALPDYAVLAENTPESLSQALGGFFGRLPSQAAALRKAYNVFAGSRASFPAVLAGDDVYPIRYGTLSLSTSGGGRSWSAREEVFNPARVHPYVPDETQARRLYEGALVQCEGELFAVMRSVLTRMPKTYGLRRGGDLLQGYSFEPPFADDSALARVPNAFLFSPAAGGGAHA